MYRELWRMISDASWENNIEMQKFKIAKLKKDQEGIVLISFLNQPGMLQWNFRKKPKRIKMMISMDRLSLTKGQPKTKDETNRKTKRKDARN